MAYTHTFTRGWASSSGGSLNRSVTAQGGLETALQETLPFPGANKLLNGIAIVITQLKGLYMVSDTPVTLTTNSSGTPVNTIELLPGVPFTYADGDTAPLDSNDIPIVNITSMYATPTVAIAALEIRILVDPTT